MPFDIYLLYASVGLVCALIIGIIRNRVQSTVFTEIVDRKFCQILIFFIVFCLVDAVWGLIGSTVLWFNRRAYVISSYGFHFMAAWSSFMCSYYGTYYLKLQGRLKKLADLSRAVLIAVQLVFLFQNLITNDFFIIDKACGYHAGSLRPYSFYLQFLHYIPLLICAFVWLFQEHQKGNQKDRVRVYTCRSAILFLLIPLLFGVLQMFFPDGAFYSMGFCVFSCAIYAFNVTSQRETYMEAYTAAAEREKSRAAIEEALDRAEAASQAKTVFLSNMSHDIRTPINGIMGMVNIAQREEMSPRAAKCLSKIDAASQHLLSLINDVLDMSRIESGKTVLNPEPMDIRVLVNYCSSIMQGQMDEKQIRFVCDCADVTHPQVKADSLHLRQILINILGNAQKFTPEGGSVTMTVTEEDARDDTVRYRFVISDTGIGMKPEFLEHIFEAFSQEDNGSRSNYKGTGLGMSIVKSLVELMGGTVTVESELGKGSTFILSIPFTIDTSAHLVEAENPTDVSIAGMKILLVEDNALNAEIASFVLEENEAVVSVAENGRIALETFRDSAPGTYDVILMDIMMPEMNGYEATRTIRALPREDAGTIPILAMTANAFEEDRVRAIESGMNSHITKPIDAAVLIRELGKFRG